MKNKLRHLMAALILFISLISLSHLNLVNATSSKVAVCPGDGYGCALWGAIEKGDNRGFIEIKKDNKQTEAEQVIIE